MTCSHFLLFVKNMWKHSFLICWVFFLSDRFFYDNPIQFVGQSAFQHLPELRTLWAKLQFGSMNHHILLSSWLNYSTNFDHSKSVTYFFPVVFRSLNGAADIMQFPDLTGTHSLERLWVPTVLSNHVLKYTVYLSTFSALPQNTGITDQANTLQIYTVAIFTYYTQCIQFSCLSRLPQKYCFLFFLIIHFYNLYIIS